MPVSHMSIASAGTKQSSRASIDDDLRTKNERTYRVPYLQFNLLIINRHHATPELDADGEIVHALEPFIRELQK